MHAWVNAGLDRRGIPVLKRDLGRVFVSLAQIGDIQVSLVSSTIFLSVLLGMSAEFNAPHDPCGLKDAVRQMVEARENALPKYKDFKVILTESDKEIQVDFYHRNGARLSSQTVPYDTRACAPSIDRIGLALDAFMTDFTKCGQNEDKQKALPVSRLPKVLQASNESSNLGSQASSDRTQRHKKTTAIIPYESETKYDHKISLGLFGTGESHIDHLLMHYGGKLKLKYAHSWIKLFGVVGVIGELQEDVFTQSQNQADELRILPVYALVGSGECISLDSQEFCLLGYVGREIFFGEFVPQDSGTSRSQTLSQWLFEGGLEYGYKLSNTFTTHLGFNLGFRPGSLQFTDSQFKLSGWTWNAYTGFSFDLVKI